MYLSSGYLPPELWLVIAAHLSPGEISQLARLCRPFAALAYERNEGHISTLRLPVHTSVEGDTPDMDRNDEASSVRDFVNMLKQTIDSDRAPRIRRLLLYPARHRLRDVPRPNGILRQLGQLFTRTPDNYRDISRLYEHLNIDSLTLLLTSSSPALANHLSPVVGSTWSAFSANLRELAISIDTTTMLQLYLSGIGSPFALPRLEVMRLSYSRIGDKDPDRSMLQQLAQMYRTQTLRVLELHLNVYPPLDLHLLQTLLPPAEAVVSLNTFSLAAPTRSTSRVELTEIILAFIKPHLATLIHFGIHCSSTEIGLILDSHVAFRSDVALSFDNLSSEQAHQLSTAGESGNIEHVRDSILELTVGFQRQPTSVSWLATFRNLCALSVTIRDVQLDYLVRLARAAPRLESLHVNNTQIGEPPIPKDSPFFHNRPSVCESFRQSIQNTHQGVMSELEGWHLRDLKISSYFQHQSARDQSLQFGLLVASVLPSITSLNGCDLRDLPRSGPTDETWIWNRNSLLLKAAARRRALFSTDSCPDNILHA